MKDDAHARRQTIIDRLLTDALRPTVVGRLPSHRALAPDMQCAIDRLLAKVANQTVRSLTYEELEDALPKRDVSADDLEALFWILAEHGIAMEDGEGP